MKKPLFLAALVCGLVSFAAAATGVTCRSGAGCLNGTDHFDWTTNYGGPFNNVANGSTATSNGGVTATVNLASGDGQRLDEGNGWLGNFTPGDELIWTQGNGPLTFNFTTPVSAVGAQIEADFFGPFVAQLCDQSGNCFQEAGDGEPTEDGSAIFIGLANDPGISSVTFSLLSCVSACGDFSINQMDINGGTTPIPEPGSLLLMGTGLLGAAGAIRRKLGR